MPDQLDKYATSKKDAKAAVEKTPPESMRNLEEDVYESFNPDQKMNRNASVSS